MQPNNALSLSTLHHSLQIFGEDVSDAFVNDDLLVVSHKSGTIKMYSLPWIVKNCTVVDASLGSFVELPRGRGSEIRAGAVGNPGFGVPCTVQLAGKTGGHTEVGGIQR